jgi:hypothetical protein
MIDTIMPRPARRHSAPTHRASVQRPPLRRPAEQFCTDAANHVVHVPLRERVQAASFLSPLESLHRFTSVPYVGPVLPRLGPAPAGLFQRLRSHELLRLR